MDELTIDELTLFRDFRSDNGGPSAAETTAARARLLNAIADEGFAAPRRASWRHRMAWLRCFGRTRFWAPAAAAAAVTAIAVTMSLLATSTPATTVRPKPSQTSPTHRSPHPRHQTVRPGHGSSKRAPNRGQADGSSAGKGAASAARAPGTASAPGSPGGTGPGVSPAPPTQTTPTPTTTVLTASTAEVSPGQTDTLTATVTDQAGDNLSGGTAVFSISLPPSSGGSGAIVNLCYNVPLTYNVVDRDNIATCSYTPTAADETAWVVSAAYSGYQQYQESDSNPMDLDVGQPTTTALTISPAQVSAGQVVTLTATVTATAGSSLSGTVVFLVLPNASPGEFLYACSTSGVTLTSNTATCTYTAPATSGTYTVQAVYSGNQQQLGSESNFATFSVGG